MSVDLSSLPVLVIGAPSTHTPKVRSACLGVPASLSVTWLPEPALLCVMVRMSCHGIATQ